MIEKGRDLVVEEVEKCMLSPRFGGVRDAVAKIRGFRLIEDFPRDLTGIWTTLLRATCLSM